MTEPLSAFDPTVWDAIMGPETSCGCVLDNEDYTLTTEHAASSYGVPILMRDATGEIYGALDPLPSGRLAGEAMLTKKCGSGALMNAFLAMMSDGLARRKRIEEIANERE